MVLLGNSIIKYGSQDVSSIYCGNTSVWSGSEYGYLPSGTFLWYDFNNEAHTSGDTEYYHYSATGSLEVHPIPQSGGDNYIYGVDFGNDKSIRFATESGRRVIKITSILNSVSNYYQWYDYINDSEWSGSPCELVYVCNIDLTSLDPGQGFEFMSGWYYDYDATLMAIHNNGTLFWVATGSSLHGDNDHLINGYHSLLTDIPVTSGIHVVTLKFDGANTTVCVDGVEGAQVAVSYNNNPGTFPDGWAAGLNLYDDGTHNDVANDSYAYFFSGGSWSQNYFTDVFAESTSWLSQAPIGSWIGEMGIVPIFDTEQERIDFAQALLARYQ